MCLIVKLGIKIVRWLVATSVEMSSTTLLYIGQTLRSKFNVKFKCHHHVQHVGHLGHFLHVPRIGYLHIIAQAL